MGKSIVNLYIENGCSLGFFVRRDTWQAERYAKVVKIDMMQGQVATNTQGNSYELHRTSLQRNSLSFEYPLVMLEADWLIGGIVEIDSGGEYCWERVYPQQE